MNQPGQTIDKPVSAVKHGTGERVIVHAPFGQDGPLIVEALNGIAQASCSGDLRDFCAQILDGAVGVLTTEALSPEGVALLGATLNSQPAWSDIPLILLTARIDPAAYAFLAEKLGNLVIIQRPLDAPSLLTVVKTALRARQKQLQVRSLLAAGAAQTDRIEALNERLKRAMTETHHRVKNSLQLISALVDMQATEYEESVPIAELLRINMQVRTLAAVHDVLTQATKQGNSEGVVSAKLLLNTLFQMIGKMAGATRFRYDIEEIRLPSRQATSLALVANELILNALKHSAEEVEVTLKVSEQSVVLAVQDDGPGLSDGFDVAIASNTGLALVENLAHWDLQGATCYANRETGAGARITVTFPTTFAAEVVEAAL